MSFLHDDHGTNHCRRSFYRWVGREIVSVGIFDGLEKGKEDIFPDPASLSIAEERRTGAVKALERQLAAFAPERAQFRVASLI